MQRIRTRHDRSTPFRQLRLRAGLSRSEAAALLKVSMRSLHRYDRGDGEPSALALDTLERAAGVREAGLPAQQRAFCFIDLFAGIGGLRRGFESIGGHCVFTSE